MTDTLTDRVANAPTGKQAEWLTKGQEGRMTVGLTDRLADTYSEKVAGDGVEILNKKCGRLFVQLSIYHFRWER
jgi:hypothetical protein